MEFKVPKVEKLPKTINVKEFILNDLIYAQHKIVPFNKLHNLASVSSIILQWMDGYKHSKYSLF